MERKLNHTSAVSSWRKEIWMQVMQFTVYTERQSNYPSTVSAHGEKTSVYGLWLPGSGQQQSIPEGKKYHCRACDYQATQKSHFTTHQKSIHEGKKYHCSVYEEPSHQTPSLHVTCAVIRQLRKAILRDTRIEYTRI